MREWKPKTVDGAPPKTHDFDLVFKDQPPGAVEVTMFAGEAAMRLAGQIDRLNPIAAPDCRTTGLLLSIEVRNQASVRAS